MNEKTIVSNQELARLQCGASGPVLGRFASDAIAHATPKTTTPSVGHCHHSDRRAWCSLSHALAIHAATKRGAATRASIQPCLAYHWKHTPWLRRKPVKFFIFRAAMLRATRRRRKIAVGARKLGKHIAAMAECVIQIAI